MDVKKVDSNFILKNVNRSDIMWRDCKDKPFSVHGIYFDEKSDKFIRMPLDVTSSVGETLQYLATFSAGGRIRFKTNSSFIALKVTLVKTFDIMTHMPISGEYGFSIYVDGKYYMFISPTQFDIEGKTDFITFDGILDIDGKDHEIDIYLPLYHSVKEVLVGLEENAQVQSPRAYKHSKPVVFYGSSITQGGCASHAGNDYVSLVARWLDTDVINLGFSGNAKGEQFMADYLATLDVSVFMLDYDHNAPTLEHLKNTHYPLYKTIRSKNPNTPIVFSSRPDFENGSDSGKRRDLIKENYQRALAEGDMFVDFIDGQTLFETEDRDCCTVDGCHPNDLGFYRMAKTILPVLEKWLNK